MATQEHYEMETSTKIFCNHTIKQMLTISSSSRHLRCTMEALAITRTASYQHRWAYLIVVGAAVQCSLALITCLPLLPQRRASSYFRIVHISGLARYNHGLHQQCMSCSWSNKFVRLSIRVDYKRKVTVSCSTDNR